MKLNGKHIKRLIIYFFYDKDGIVDRYVTYMLNDLKKNCSELFVVVNGKLTYEGRRAFQSVGARIMVRENVGFDVWAYKKALEHYGWNKLKQYDEVVLMNFTIMGPLYPFSEVFEKMNQKDLDFWGLTKHHGAPADYTGLIPYGCIHEHIQSSFIVVRNKMLCSNEFYQYWKNMPMIKNYKEAVAWHEAIFTDTFINYGFKDGIYVDTSDLKKHTDYPLMIEALELVKNRRCPVFKRKAFSNDYYEFLNASLGEPTIELYNYIDKHTDYNIEMIWENILRLDNMWDIKNRMHLNRILPYDKSVYYEQTLKMKTALVMHIYFEDQVEYCLNYAKSMPESSDVFFTLSSEKVADVVREKMHLLSPRKIKIVMIENRGRDVSALLVGAAPYVNDYDLICFAHDKKTLQVEPYSAGESFRYKCFENILGSREYVENIIGTFYNEPRLGMMTPPPPNHAAFFGGVGYGWGPNYDITVELAQKLDIKCDININKEPIAPLGTMFWFRPSAMKDIYKKVWKYKDFPKEPNKIDGTLLHAIERIYGYAAQNQGFYSAWGMHDKFAAIEMTNYNFMLSELSKAIWNFFGYHGTFNFIIYSIVHAKILPESRLAEATETVATPSEGKLKKIKIKSYIKKITPKPIWNFMKKTYHKFGGTKWVG